MSEISINLNDLYNLVRRMRRDDMAYAILRISPPEVIDGEQYPSCLEFVGVRSSNLDVGVDYDFLDSAEISLPDTLVSRSMT